MIDLKPYGALIENTLRPLLLEVDSLLTRIDKMGFNLSKCNIEFLLKYIAERHMLQSLLDLAKTVIVTAIVCYTVLRLT